MEMQALETIRAELADGRVVPYLGPGVLALAGEQCPIPASPEALVEKLTAKASVPHKIRNNLTAAAQFIENFKHRKTVTTAMTEAFRSDAGPTSLHRYLATLANLPLLVHAWYDDLPQKALGARSDWGMVQGVSQSEHFGTWAHYFAADGSPVMEAQETESRGDGEIGGVTPAIVSNWSTLLYQPLGSVSPAANFLVSDTDFVEVLTEIDIQTPIPEPVQRLRSGRHFLFLGCRFSSQLPRIFARQVMKRSSERHWAVLPEEPTRNEARFLEQYHIERIEMPLEDFMTALAGETRGEETRRLALAT